jgi:Cu+-exporting ATPase
VQISVQGMTCAACVARVERALQKVPGVVLAQVNLATERATVHYQPVQVRPSELKAAIRRAGYEVLEAVPGQDTRQLEEQARLHETHKLRRVVGWAVGLAFPLVLISMLPMAWPALHHQMLELWPAQNWNLLMWALATPVMFGPGWRFIRLGYKALASRSPDMNALVLLGTGSAYIYSTVVTLWPDGLPETARHVYFEAAAVVIALVLLGKYLEAVARGRTSQALQKLLALQPPVARVVRGEYEHEIPVDEVEVGDLLRVRPGEKVPVDGTVEQGQSYLDESLITGEAMPVLRQPGARVVAGTLNTTGTFVMRTEAVGAGTLLAQIVRLVEEAQGSKPPIQGLADRVVAVFTPVVLVIALLTALVWLIWGGADGLNQALIHTVAVLIVACPCAMGLAIPTSLMVGTGKGAELGVLFRSGGALEQLARARSVALDKTGTLTLGRPQLTQQQWLAPYTEQQLSAWIAAAEQGSEHPLGRTLAALAPAPLPAAESFENLPGQGVLARVEGHELAIGSDRLMQDLGVDAVPLIELANQWASQGATPVWVAVDRQLAGLLAVADPIKETTPQALQALRQLGLEPVMITGDNHLTAQAVGRTLGIGRVLSEVRPADKAQAVQNLQRQGAVVFVGDGVNDAPALAQADVGVALRSGTDIAVEAADVVLVSSDLRAVPNAVALARATLNNIRLNLFWAFAYNILLIPVAAGAFYPVLGWQLNPVLAGAAMGLSSVFVLSNALRLRGFRPMLSPGGG